MLATDFLGAHTVGGVLHLIALLPSGDLTARAAALQLSRLTLSRACFVGGTILSFSTAFELIHSSIFISFCGSSICNQ